MNHQPCIWHKPTKYRQLKSNHAARHPVRLAPEFALSHVFDLMGEVFWRMRRGVARDGDQFLNIQCCCQKHFPSIIVSVGSRYAGRLSISSLSAIFAWRVQYRYESNEKPRLPTLGLQMGRGNHTHGTLTTASTSRDDYSCAASNHDVVPRPNIASYPDHAVILCGTDAVSRSRGAVFADYMRLTRCTAAITSNAAICE